MVCREKHITCERDIDQRPPASIADERLACLVRFHAERIGRLEHGAAQLISDGSRITLKPDEVRICSGVTSGHFDSSDAHPHPNHRLIRVLQYAG